MLLILRFLKISYYIRYFEMFWNFLVYNGRNVIEGFLNLVVILIYIILLMNCEVERNVFKLLIVFKKI